MGASLEHPRCLSSGMPAGMVDVARRLSEDNRIFVAEIWSYHSVGDEIRFTLVHRSREMPATVRAAQTRRPERPAARRPVATAGRRKAPARAAGTQREARAQNETQMKVRSW